MAAALDQVIPLLELLPEIAGHHGSAMGIHAVGDVLADQADPGSLMQTSRNIQPNCEQQWHSTQQDCGDGITAAIAIQSASPGFREASDESSIQVGSSTPPIRDAAENDSWPGVAHASQSQIQNQGHWLWFKSGEWPSLL